MIGFKKLSMVAACTAAMGLAGLSGCGMMGGGKAPTPEEKMKMMDAAPGDIIDTATGPNMEDVTTVVTAIKAAGLVETLKGKGPFTVFAPTNEAFAALPPGTVDSLLKPENQGKLKDILLYHVHVGDGIVAAEAHDMGLTTAEGKSIAVTVVDGKVMLNGTAKVVKADIICKNGVIHWIDKVLMPPTGMSAMPGM